MNHHIRFAGPPGRLGALPGSAARPQQPPGASAPPSRPASPPLPAPPPVPDRMPVTAAEVDRHVGARIRERRVMLGLSQQQLAQLIGVTYQQAHKYERGLNRIAAGRLYEIAQALDVPVGWFFFGLDQGGRALPNAQQRRGLELARYFSAIRSERHQEALTNMARALAASESNENPEQN